MADAGKALGGGATLATGIATGNPIAMVSGGIGLLGGLFGSDNVSDTL